ncbi:MAG: hypothetical protein MJZ49_01180 [Bacteroidales bacterium]|nr:hypothetical protein [Bacteroidales bacterium]
MYNIELQNLTLQDAQNRILGAVENICDSFHLDEQFGTISYGMHELMSLVERCSETQFTNFTVNFYVESDRISVQLLNFNSLTEVAQMIDKASFNDADTAAFTVACLTDKHELRNNGQELWFDIMVTPTFDTVDRAAILQQNTKKVENL